MSKPKVIIAGDSWGCGEWTEAGNEIGHYGLEQYFKDGGHDVVNTARSNSSNKDSINRLSQVNVQESDIVLWIQSDPLRDLRPFHTLTEDINDSGGLEQLLDKLLNDSYTKLNQLGYKVNLIGGLFNIRDISKFTNLLSVVPSWINMLVGQMPEYQNTKDLTFGILQAGGSINNIRLTDVDQSIVKQVITDFHYYSFNDRVFREDIFRPDGCHPNRHGHKIAFDEIINRLKL